MTIRPVMLLAPLLGLVLAFLSPFERLVPPDPKARKATAVQARGVWTDMRFLTRHLEEGCNVARDATGDRFKERPSIKVSNAEEVAAILVADLEAVFRTLGAADEQEVAAMGKGLAAGMVAHYESKANLIHVLPDNATAIAEATEKPELVSKEVLRLLLVRMAVRALDTQAFPNLEEGLKERTTAEEVHVLGAVIEGHAQRVTERVAEFWKTPGTFPLLQELLTAKLPAAEGVEPGPAEALEAEAEFAFVKGHVFMKTVDTKKGRRRVESVLKDPPKTRKEIEDPITYIRPKPRPPKPSKAFDAEKVFKEFRPLVEGEGWTPTETKREKADLEAMLAGVPKAHYTTVLLKYRGGTELRVAHAEKGTSLRILLLEFTGSGMAEAFVGLYQTALEEEDREDLKLGDDRRFLNSKYEENAGRDSGLSGFVLIRTVKDGDAKKKATLQAVHEGRFVQILETDEASIDRDTQDDALESSTDTLRVLQQGASSRRGRGPLGGG